MPLTALSRLWTRQGRSEVSSSTRPMGKRRHREAAVFHSSTQDESRFHRICSITAPGSTTARAEDSLARTQWVPETYTDMQEVALPTASIPQAYSMFSYLVAWKEGGVPVG